MNDQLQTVNEHMARALAAFAEPWRQLVEVFQTQLLPHVARVCEALLLDLPPCERKRLRALAASVEGPDDE